MSLPAGISIPKPDVVFTDLGLAILGAYLGWRLWTARGEGMLPRTGVVVVGGLASAAFWGAIFHAFFPANTATPAGFMAWIPVALSILVVALVSLLGFGLDLLLVKEGLPRRAMMIFSNTLTGLIAGWLFYSFACHERRRRAEKGDWCDRKRRHRSH